MKPSSTFDFRQFQEELAALDRNKPAPAPVTRAPKKASPMDRLAQAKVEFLELRERFGLTVADVVAFFPEEEGVSYLQGLIQGLEAKPRRRKKEP